MYVYSDVVKNNITQKASFKYLVSRCFIYQRTGIAANQ